MAGNTNLAYRRLCRRFGAEMTTTEMVSARALVQGNCRTGRLLERDPEEVPVAAQVFGAEPAVVGEAAAICEGLGFHAVDLNMGCPVPKITGGGGGSALLRNPARAARVVEAMARATAFPVTVKIRAGWDDQKRDAPRFATAMESAGARAITIHGRTREQKYSGQADYELIGEVADAVDIPVIGNGDVVDVRSALRLASFGVAGLAIGRGALGRPWIFAQIRAGLRGEPVPEAPAPEERAALLQELARGVVDLYGEAPGMKIMRRLAADFLKGTPGAPALRSRCNRLATLHDLEELLGREPRRDQSSGISV